MRASALLSTFLAVTLAVSVTRAAEGAGAAGQPAAAGPSQEAVGAALRRLDWWEKTTVTVRKLESYEQSEEQLLASIPASTFPLDWYILGPIPAKNLSDCYRPYPPEAGVDVAAPVTIGEQKFPWQRPFTAEKVGGGLELSDLFKARQGGVAYLHRELTVAQPTDTNFYLGFAGGCRLWLNGKEVFASDASGFTDTDRIELPVHLEAGTNRLLVKTFSRGSSWAFFFHTGDVHPRHARIKGRWVLADLFPEAPDRQLAARLRVVHELVDSGDVASLRAATDLLRELAPTAPMNKEFLATVQRVATSAQDRGEEVEAERPWTFANELLARAPDDLRPSLEPAFLSSLAAARSRLGDLRGAQRLYRQLVETYPKAEVTAEGLWVLAEYLRREGRTAEAQAYYEKLLSDFPSDQRVKAVAAGLVWCERFPGDRPVRKGSFSAAQHLAQAARLEGTGNAQSALQLYLDALRQWPDELVRLETDRLASIVSIVQDRTRTLWPALPPEAQAELTRAAEQGFALPPASQGDEGLGELLRQHPLAASAADVLACWAEALLEEGALGRAAAALVTLLENYQLQPATQAQTETELAFCAGMLGDRTLYNLARRRLADEPPQTAVTWAGGQATVADVRAWLGAHAPKPEADLPALDRLPATPTLVRLLPDHRSEELLSNRWPTPRLPVPWRPLLMGDILFSHDQERARALNLAGATLWRSDPYPQPLRGIVGRNFAGQPGYLAVADDRRLYAVELAADTAFRATRTALFAYDRATGRVLWSTESEPGLADREVGSPPVAAFDRLYFVAYRRDVLAEEYLVALDPETGHVLSSTLIAAANSSLKVFRDQANTSDYDATSLLPPPAADATHLYVLTQMGSVVAVDALSQALDWVLEYPRTSLTSTDDAFFLNYVCRGLSVPLVVGDLLLAVPRDSGELLAIERKSGALRWRRADYEFSELWGVGHPDGGNAGVAPAEGDALSAQLVVASDVPGAVVACSVETGEVRWSWRPGEHRIGGEPWERAGRGVVTGGRVIVPTGKALYELSLADGRVQATRSLGVACAEVTGLAASPQGIAAAWEGGLLLWPLHAEGGAAAVEETYVQAVAPTALRGEAPTQLRAVEEQAPPAEAPSPEPAGAPPTGAPAAAAPGAATQEPTGAEPTQPGETESAESEMMAWAPVAPVAAADSSVALLPREGGEDVVTWDGTWLSYYRLQERPELRWRRALRWTAPQLRVNSYLLVVAAGPELLALERESGRELWRWSIPVRAGGYGPFDGDSRSFRDVCVSESLVVAGVARKVFGLDAHTGTERWSFGLENDLRTVALEGERVFVAATHYSGRLFTYALDLTDGRPRSEAEFRDIDARNPRTVAVGHSLWYIEAERRRVTAYDLAQGTQLWREAYGDLNLAEYLGADERYLFFVLRPPRGQPPRLLAVEKVTGARAFVVDSAQFQYALRPQNADRQESFVIYGLTGGLEHIVRQGGRTTVVGVHSTPPQSYLVLNGDEVGLEAGPLLLCQQGTDLVAWRPYRNDEVRRWPLFAEQEILTGVARSGRLLFLAVARPVVPALLQAKTPSGERPGPETLLMQLAVRVVELPEGKVRGQAALPPMDAGLPNRSVVPLAHGLLSRTEAGCTLLAPVPPEAAVAELRSLRRAAYLTRGERTLLETLIACLEPVDLTAQPCGDGLKVTVDGDLSDWAGVPAVSLAAADGAWVWSFPEVASPPTPSPATKGSIRLAWDAENLYLALEVEDADHHPPREAGAEWRSDALILRLVTQTLTQGVRSLRQQVFFGSPGAAVRERWQGNASQADKVAIGERPGVTVYEIALAGGPLVDASDRWPPSAGQFRLALALSDRDESGLAKMLIFPPGLMAGPGLDTLARVTFAPAGESATAKQP